MFQQDQCRARFFHKDFRYNRLYRENIGQPDCQRNLTDKRTEVCDPERCTEHCVRRRWEASTGWRTSRLCRFDPLSSPCCWNIRLWRNRRPGDAGSRGGRGRRGCGWWSGKWRWRRTRSPCTGLDSCQLCKLHWRCSPKIYKKYNL